MKNSKATVWRMQVPQSLAWKKAVPVRASLGSKRATGKKAKISDASGKAKSERKSSHGDEEFLVKKNMRRI